MLAPAFVRKWGPGGPAFELNERAGAQAHFIDLCRVLGVPEPDDPQAYCFERGVTKTHPTQSCLSRFHIAHPTAAIRAATQRHNE